MNEDREIIKLKNSIAIKTLIRILLFTFLTILIFTLIIDGFYNDEIATDVSDFNRGLYLFFVQNKTIVMTCSYIIIFSIVSFFVTRNMSTKLLEITSAVDKVLKESEKEIKLPNDLMVLESKLNKIRLDLIKNQNAAKEAETKKNDLIMYMAHDLKTPLTSVIGYLTLINDEKNISNESKEKYTKIALDKALRVEDLTNQFFEITRYNLQDMPINKKNINLSMLIDQLVDECYPMLQERSLKCNVKKLENVYYAADGDKIARAFGNLLKNAINYSYENTEIEINMNENEEKIEIMFRNKGDKIPKYKLEKIFEKFYRVDAARQSSTGGTGLGLAISKEIIDLHNGNIYVKNDTEWIEFYVELFK